MEEVTKIEKSEITEKIRNIRKLRGYTQEQLARKAEIPYATLTKIESGVIKNPSLKTTARLAAALAVPLDDFSLVQTYSSDDNIKLLFADILSSLKPGEEMYISGIQEKLFVKAELAALSQYIDELEKRGNKQKLLSCHGDRFRLNGKHLEYRWIPKKYFNSTPIYVYDNKVACILWGPPRHVIILGNAILADAYRKQFPFMWEHAKKFK